MNIFERKNAELLTEFDRYVVEHHQITNAIPDGALVAMEVEDDQDFNDWPANSANAGRTGAGNCFHQNKKAASGAITN